jgi:hypothetical protein
MKFHFNGCSITQGAGFTNEKLDPRIYPNLIATDHINDASGGASNLKIFLHTSKAIVDNLADVYVVQWSAVHRHWVYPAPDRGIYFGSNLDPNSPNNKFITQYQLLNHDYGNIMQLIDFCRILQDQASSHNVQLLFVNGLVNWSDDIDWMKELVLGAESDHERFVEQMQNNMELVDWDLWINPWNSIYENKLDVAEDDSHPGPLTHKRIAKQLKDKLKV